MACTPAGHPISMSPRSEVVVTIKFAEFLQLGKSCRACCEEATGSADIKSGPAMNSHRRLQVPLL
jgi:hypothetical protein